MGREKNQNVKKWILTKCRRAICKLRSDMDLGPLWRNLGHLPRYHPRVSATATLFSLRVRHTPAAQDQPRRIFPDFVHPAFQIGCIQNQKIRIKTGSDRPNLFVER